MNTYQESSEEENREKSQGIFGVIAIVISLALIASGITVIVFAYIFQSDEEETDTFIPDFPHHEINSQEVFPNDSPWIHLDEIKSDLDEKRSPFISLVVLEKDRSLLSFREMFKYYEKNPPQISGLLENEFLLGVIKKEEEVSAFVILDFLSPIETFRGMRDWENSLASDLNIIFQNLSDSNTHQSIMRENKEFRIQENGASYFILNSSVIISENKDALLKLLDIYQSQFMEI